MAINSSQLNPFETKSHHFMQVRIVFIVILISIAGPFASDVYIPSLPTIGAALHTTSSLVQFTITAYLLGFGSSQLVYGPLSDRRGRRNTLLIGLAISIIGSLICALSFNIMTIYIGRLVQGLGVGACTSVSRAIFRDLFVGKKLSEFSSYRSTAYSMAPAIAPLIGGYIQEHMFWRINFIFVLLYIMIIMAITWFYLPETNRYQIQNKQLPLFSPILDYFQLIKHPVFMINTFCSSIGIAAFVAYTTSSSFLIQMVVGATPMQYGWLTSLVALSIIVGKASNTQMLRFFSMPILIILGLSSMLLTGIVMLLIAWFGIINIAVIIAPTCLFVFLNGIVVSNALSGAFSPFPQFAGTVAALYGCLQIVIAFLTNIGISMINETDQSLLALTYIILSGSALVSYAILLWYQSQTDVKT